MIYKSKRWCRICRQVKTFKLNKVIQHSECEECGMRASYKLPDEVITVLLNPVRTKSSIPLKIFIDLQNAHNKLKKKYDLLRKKLKVLKK